MALLRTCTYSSRLPAMASDGFNSYAEEHVILKPVTNQSAQKTTFGVDMIKPMMAQVRLAQDCKENIKGEEIKSLGSDGSLFYVNFCQATCSAMMCKICRLGISVQITTSGCISL